MGRLIAKMKEYVTVNGMMGKADLCKAANRGMRQIENYLSGQSIPSAQVRYQLALACGCTKKEALVLANEEPEAKTAC